MTETTTKPGSADAGDSTQSRATAPKPDTKPDTLPEAGAFYLDIEDEIERGSFRPGDQR